MSGHRTDREVIVVGYGLEYLVMAYNCGLTVKASNPGLATALVTNVPVLPGALDEAFDRVIVRDEPADRNRLVKTSILEHAVAEQVLYLDADCEVLGDLDPLFRLLERFDVGLKVHASPVNKAFELIDGVPGGVFAHFSGGMLLLRAGEEAQRFLAQWQRRFVDSGLARDQPALARTVLDLPDLRLITLSTVWLATIIERDVLHGAKHEAPRIVHYGLPQNEPAAARRIRHALPDVIAALPSEQGRAAEAVRLDRKYRIITHPLYANRMTRRAYLALVYRAPRWRRAARDGLLERSSAVQGRPYTRDAGPLWDD